MIPLKIGVKEARAEMELHAVTAKTKSRIRSV